MHSKKAHRYRFDLHVKCHETDENEANVGTEVEAVIAESRKPKAESRRRSGKLSVSVGIIARVVSESRSKWR